MTEEYQLTFNDYISIIKRRWLYFLVPFILISAISAVIAIMIPPVYQSKGIILIESQQIPSQIVQSTVTGYVNERIQVIKQRILVRQSLLEVINKYGLFSKDKDKLSVSEQIELLREQIEVSPVVDDFGRQRVGRNGAVIAFNLGYEHREPLKAQAVANELVTLFLDENVKTRTARAAETTEFLNEEVKKLKSQLEKIEQEIVLFKEENSDALPENLGLNTSILERTENSIKTSKQRIDQIHQEIKFLEIELSAAKKTPNINQDQVVVLTPEQKLAQLQLTYSELTSEYTDHHPDVKKVIREIELITKEIEQPKAASDHAKTQKELGIDVARIHAQMEALNREIKTLNAQIVEQEEKRQNLEKVILKTPQVKNALLSLTRDYDNTLAQFKEMQAKELDADLAVSLEQQNKAERFTLIEAPLKPEAPIRPNRVKVFSAGLLIALLIGAGLVFLLELLNHQVWGEDAITRIISQRPLISIPYIQTSDELRKKRSLLIKLGMLFMVLLMMALLSLHVLYMPLDLLFYKIMLRLG